MMTYVLVCSDDPEWCAEQEFFDDERFLINTDVPEYDHLCLEGDGSRRRSKVPYTDLCLMSLCNGLILSSSSLGWWGAWLQNGRTNPVIVPEHWYGPILEQSMIVVTSTPKTGLLSRTDMKRDLKDTTFIIPICIESEDRMRNVITSLCYILDNFDTKVILKEADSESVFQNTGFFLRLQSMLEDGIENLTHIFEKSELMKVHSTVRDISMRC